MPWDLMQNYLVYINDKAKGLFLWFYFAGQDEKWDDFFMLMKYKSRFMIRLNYYISFLLLVRFHWWIISKSKRKTV